MKRNLLFTIALLTIGARAYSTPGAMYAAGVGLDFYSVNLATGACTNIGTVSPNAGNVAELTYDRFSNKIYASSTSNDSLYTINLQTKVATLVGYYGRDNLYMHGIEFDSSTSTLYGAPSATNDIFRINTSTAALTPVGQSTQTFYAELGYNSDSDTMYLANYANASLYTLNRQTAAATLVGPLMTTFHPSAMAYNSDNHTMYMLDNLPSRLFTVNLGTGAATMIGNTGDNNILSLVYIPAHKTIRGPINLTSIAPPNLSTVRQIAVAIEGTDGTYHTTVEVGIRGEFEIPVPIGMTGLVRMQADGSSFLRKTQWVNLGSSGADVATSIQLVNGDVDHSGEVDAVDIDVVIAHFGATDGGDWDVDMSGEVDAVDIDIVIGNFGAFDQ